MKCQFIYVSNFSIRIFCCRSVAQSCPTLCDPMDYSTQACLSFTVSWSLLKLMSTVSVMPFNHRILWCPLFLLPSIFPSIRVFSNESTLRIRWPKYHSFSLSPSNEYPGLIPLQSEGLSRVFYNTTVQKHQFFGTQPSLWSNSHIHTWLLAKL